MTGLYIHIPFCKSKCGYCDFCSTTSYDEKMMDRYLAALVLQMDNFFHDKNNKTDIDTIYFGGGTPSVWGGKRIAKMIKAISKSANIQKNAEITVEANPESCDKRFLKQLRATGVNRLSLGVQSAVDTELLEIGRLHNYEQAKTAVQHTKKYLTDNISLDLIYGLPNQTQVSLSESLDAIIALEPMHISAYGLKLEPDCTMYGKPYNLADDDTQADMYLSVCERLKQAGYAQYEISNWAKHGKISRHNSKYWDLSEYLGLGAAAHSLYCGKRFSTTSDIKKYIENIERGLSVTEEQEELATDERMGEYIMLALRTSVGINEEYFWRTFGRDFEAYGNRIKKYIDTGHVEYDGMRYRLSPKGFLISNTIISDALGDGA